MRQETSQSGNESGKVRPTDTVRPTVQHIDSALFIIDFFLKVHCTAMYFLFRQLLSEMSKVRIACNIFLRETHQLLFSE